MLLIKAAGIAALVVGAAIAWGFVKLMMPFLLTGAAFVCATWLIYEGLKETQGEE